MKKLLAFAALVLFASSASARGELFTVDVAGGADFTTLDDAVAHAPASSTLVVGAGNYTLSDPLTHGLEIIADPSVEPRPRIDQGAGLALSMHSVPVGEHILLRGFQLGSIEFFDMLGQVWVEDCAVAGPSISMRIHNCVAVTLRSCTLASGLDKFGDPSQPLFITGGSTVQIFDTRSRSLAGGSLGSGACVHRPAVEVRQFSSFYAADSEFHGSGCGPGGSSGGIRALEMTKVRLRNTIVEAGLGSPQAVDVELLSGATLEEVADVPRALGLSALIAAGTSTSAELTGAPFEPAFVLWSLEPGATYVAQLFSPLALARPWGIAAGLALDAEGHASIPFAATLPPGATCLTLFAQSLHPTALGGPGSLTIVP